MVFAAVVVGADAVRMVVVTTEADVTIAVDTALAAVVVAVASAVVDADLVVVGYIVADVVIVVLVTVVDVIPAPCPHHAAPSSAGKAQVLHVSWHILYWLSLFEHQ